MIIPKLIVVCGLSFAGKSTLGKAIAERFSYAEVDVDETKVYLYGPDVVDETLTHTDWVRIYEETDNLIEGHLRSGSTVIDASRNFRKFERQAARQLANQLGCGVVTMFVDTPEVIVRQRWLENRKTNARRDVSDQEFEEIIEAMEPPTADEDPLVFRFGVETVLRRIIIAPSLLPGHTRSMCGVIGRAERWKAIPTKEGTMTNHKNDKSHNAVRPAAGATDTPGMPVVARGQLHPAD